MSIVLSAIRLIHVESAQCKGNDIGEVGIRRDRVFDLRIEVVTENTAPFFAERTTDFDALQGPMIEGISGDNVQAPRRDLGSLVSEFVHEYGIGCYDTGIPL